jgi:hypothetical protein
MEHEQHGSVALVEIVDLGPVDLLEVTLEWVLIPEEPGRSLHVATVVVRPGWGPVRVSARPRDG